VASFAGGAQTGDLAGLTALLPWLACALAGLLLHFASHGQYTRRVVHTAELQDLIPGCLGALCATAMAAYITHNERAQLPVLLGWAVLPFSILGMRALARTVLRAACLWRIPVVIVGDGEDAEVAIGALRAVPCLGYDITGRVRLADLSGLLSDDGWHGLLAAHGADMVVLAYDEADPMRPASRTLEALAREGVQVSVMRRTRGLPALGCISTAFVGHEAVMMSHAAPRGKPLSRLVKAAMDVSAAVLALLLLLPLFLVITLLVRADGGPAFFAHRRIGINGRSFQCLKFRTMVVNSDAVMQQFLAENTDAAREWEDTQKLRNDPRVTWIGRVLRKTSLDELPQLINVLRLEMSLVGPRPIVTREISRYGDDIAYYYGTRPGITGLWQVSGRNNTTYARRVELDRWYVKNWSMGQDLAILARTLPAVLTGRGAS